MSCHPCNNKKANKLIKPLTIPRAPTYFELVNKRKKFPLVIGDYSWNKYLNWDEDKVSIGNTKRYSLNIGDINDHTAE